MRNSLIYDLPTRIFHWLFAALFLGAFAIGKIVDDESLLFSYHMLLGLMMGGLIFWRFIWGFVGSQHARFSGFNLNPTKLFAYFKGIITGSKHKDAGHNPASSWAAITMMILGLGLSITGFLMTTGAKESFEDIHELMANSFIVVVALHVSGIILHSIRHRDAIALSMIDGKKDSFASNATINSSRPVAALLLIAFIAGGAIVLSQNFNSTTRELNLFGQTLQLGDNELGGNPSINSESNYDSRDEEEDHD
ncbi:MAG: cytochrome b/b6 domain-containing protein [Bdellovibrionia bacterium]